MAASLVDRAPSSGEFDLGQLRANQTSFADRPYQVYLEVGPDKPGQLTVEKLEQILRSAGLRYRVSSKPNLVEVFEDARKEIGQNRKIELLDLFLEEDGEFSDGDLRRLAGILTNIAQREHLATTRWTVLIDEVRVTTPSPMWQGPQPCDPSEYVNDDDITKWMQALPLIPEESKAVFATVKSLHSRHGHLHKIDGCYVKDILRRIDNHYQRLTELEVVGQAIRNPESTGLASDTWKVVAGELAKNLGHTSEEQADKIEQLANRKG